MANAKSAGLLVGDPAAMTEQFLGLLWGDLMTGLLLQVANRPSAGEIARRAREATIGLLHIYPEPRSVVRSRKGWMKPPAFCQASATRATVPVAASRPTIDLPAEHRIHHDRARLITASVSEAW